ncbi:RNA helicase [Ranunculus cassubicifolius]
MADNPKIKLSTNKPNDKDPSFSSSPIELNLQSLSITESKVISSFHVTSEGTLYSAAKAFEDLNLPQELLEGIYNEMKFTRPSKIQAISLPMILTPPYKNLIAQAHNGCGKTTCFVLGMLSRVDPNIKAPQALCICPTRELAIQNMEVLKRMSKHTRISSYCAISGNTVMETVAIFDQIVIGTPGTVKGLISRKKLSTRQLRFLVFDEADHMLADDGFKDDSMRIIKDIEKSSLHCQVLLFSATFNDTVKRFATRVVPDANYMYVKKEELTLDMVKQYKVHCPDENAKIQAIKEKIFDLVDKLGQSIIFVHSRASANALHKSLTTFGWEVTTIHGAVDIDKRDAIIKEFKNGLTSVLISTDLLCRGFDQSQVNLVINYDLPVKYDSPGEPDYEVYLHRCGRAGRFGRKGAVFNLLCQDNDHMLMNKIQNYFRHEIVEVPNWNSDEDFGKALKEAGLL